MVSPAVIADPISVAVNTADFRRADEFHVDQAAQCQRPGDHLTATLWPTVLGRGPATVEHRAWKVG